MNMNMFTHSYFILNKEAWGEEATVHKVLFLLGIFTYRICFSAAMVLFNYNDVTMYVL